MTVDELSKIYFQAMIDDNSSTKRAATLTQTYIEKVRERERERETQAIIGTRENVYQTQKDAKIKHFMA